jgi:hypothetical protein
MDLFYKNNENDSLSVSFVVNESCARFTQFNHAYSQEVIDVIDNPALAAERIYCQNMSGLRPRVDFPDLKTWQNGRRILINKARNLRKHHPTSLTKLKFRKRMINPTRKI